MVTASNAALNDAQRDWPPCLEDRVQCRQADAPISVSREKPDVCCPLISKPVLLAGTSSHQNLAGLKVHRCIVSRRRLEKWGGRWPWRFGGRYLQPQLLFNFL